MGDTAGARAAAQRATGTLSDRLHRGFDAEIALLTRDYAAAMRGFAAGTPEFLVVFPHRSLNLALAAAASGDSALARVHADTLLRVGAAELEARRARSGVDPFGRQSFVESQMAIAYALRGERERAVRLAEASARAFGIERDAIDGASPRQHLALTYMLVGRRADAIATLASLLAVPSGVTVQRLRLDPTYDSLRDEPAFQQLVTTGR
jgi:hypothetical protein